MWTAPPRNVLQCFDHIFLRPYVRCAHTGTLAKMVSAAKAPKQMSDLIEGHSLVMDRLITPSVHYLASCGTAARLQLS